MEKTLTTYDIAHELLNDENANWSRAGAFALAEWLEELEESSGEDLDLDIVAIRCDFSEYESAQDAAENYGWEPSEESLQDTEECESDSHQYLEAIKFLENRTSVIEFDGGVIIQDF
jgi:hypothetical protein